jgi:alpha-beta hydrolase superfamily lysophospholipase
MFNHDRLVNTLSKAGYRIIAFDYPGQGGSEGSMDQTRITRINPEKSFLTSVLEGFEDDHKKDSRFAEFKGALSKHKPGSFDTLLISDMADKVWEKIKNGNDKIGSKEQIDAVIGWSTGGLAAYDMAAKKKKGIKAVVLIAPGTNTKFVFKIETKTLNGNTEFEHVDNIRPDSPLKIPGFTINLLASGLASQKWEVASDVKGLVLLSDPKKDSYVDSEAVERTLRRNTKDSESFEFVRYDGAAHEIDNESDPNRTDKSNNLKYHGLKLEERVVKFLDKVFC